MKFAEFENAVSEKIELAWRDFCETLALPRGDENEQEYKIKLQKRQKEAKRAFLNAFVKYFPTTGAPLEEILRKKYPDMDVNGDKIVALCESNHVSGKDLPFDEKTFRNWFTPSYKRYTGKGAVSRKKYFALAFGLRLNVKETEILFNKVYLDIAFDMRREEEVIYWYCINKGKTWQDAKKMIQALEEEPRESENATAMTAMIREQVKAIDTEEDLLRYIAKNERSFSKKMVTAKQKREELFEEAGEKAGTEGDKKAGKKASAEDDKKAGKKASAEDKKKSKDKYYKRIIDEKTGKEIKVIKHPGKLFNAILYSAELHDEDENKKDENKEDENKEENKKEIKKENRRGEKAKYEMKFCTAITDRFPDIKSIGDNNLEYQEMRKTIMFLHFYCFWRKVQDNEQYKGGYDKYKREINRILGTCGFSPLYAGNPFDGLFLFCSMSKDADEPPIERFRGIYAYCLDPACENIWQE